MNFSPETTWLQAVVWLLYVVPVMYLFFRPARKPATNQTAPAQPASAQPTTTEPAPTRTP